MSRRTGALLATCAWLAIVATASSATAQELDEPEDPLRAATNDVVHVETADGADLDRTVEQWIFGGNNADAIRKRIEAALAQNIKRFDQKYGLTAAQKKKLELAGRYDMKRFFDGVEETKAEYRRVKGDWNQVGNRIFELQRVHNQVFTELFGDESMLAKTLKKTLTVEQIAHNCKMIYMARAEWMAGLLDRRLALNADQHRRLVNLIIEETPPLRRYGSFDYDAIMFQLSRLPRARLLTALEEAQCRELTLRFDQARRMESILVSEGYLPRVIPPASPALRAAEKAASTGADRIDGRSP
jgi:hypothetical protein